MNLNIYGKSKWSLILTTSESQKTRQYVAQPIKKKKNNFYFKKSNIVLLFKPFAYLRFERIIIFVDLLNMPTLQWSVLSPYVYSSFSVLSLFQIFWLSNPPKSFPHSWSIAKFI